MKQRPAGRPSSSEQIIRDIKRKTRKQYSADEKIRIVLDGVRLQTNGTDEQLI
jgi:transposase